MLAGLRIWSSKYLSAFQQTPVPVRNNMGTAKYVFVRDDYLFNRMTLAIDNVNMKKRRI